MAEPTAPRHGTFCWNELLTSDVNSATRFYAGLFGWSTQARDMGGGRQYTMAKLGETQVGGLMPHPMAGTPSHWLAYVAVDDVDRVADLARQLGGQVLQPPTDIPGIGRFAVIQDPTGAVLGLFRGTGS